MKPKSWIIEPMFTIAIGVFAWLLLSAWPGMAALDINLRDTYFVVDRKTVIIIGSCLIIAPIYFIRAACYKFRRRLCNSIALIFNLWLAVQLFMIIRFLAPFTLFQHEMSAIVQAKNGWTVYPPLSALPKAAPQPAIAGWQKAALDTTWQTVTFYVVLSMLLITTFFAGKNWNPNRHESAEI